MEWIIPKARVADRLLLILHAHAQIVFRGAVLGDDDGANRHEVKDLV